MPNESYLPLIFCTFELVNSAVFRFFAAGFAFDACFKISVSSFVNVVIPLSPSVM